MDTTTSPATPDGENRRTDYLDRLRDVGAHGAAASLALTDAYTAADSRQRRAALAALAEQVKLAAGAVRAALAAVDRGTGR